MQQANGPRMDDQRTNPESGRNLMGGLWQTTKQTKPGSTDFRPHVAGDFYRAARPIVGAPQTPEAVRLTTRTSKYRAASASPVPKNRHPQLFRRREQIISCSAPTTCDFWQSSVPKILSPKSSGAENFFVEIGPRPLLYPSSSLRFIVKRCFECLNHYGAAVLYRNHKGHHEHEANQQTLAFVSFVFFVVIRNCLLCAGGHAVLPREGS
jgi:hypothetical protein